VGVARSHALPPDLDAVLEQVQVELFVAGAELACPAGDEQRLHLPLLDDAAVSALERHIDALEAELSPLRSFVLPAGTPAASALHLARTVCRRAERLTWSAGRDGVVRPVMLAYLNRLSDLLFVLARAANHRAGVPDVPWQPRETRPDR
jgi:cob(I)alamin adenosyltransferase